MMSVDKSVKVGMWKWMLKSPLSRFPTVKGSFTSSMCLNSSNVVYPDLRIVLRISDVAVMMLVSKIESGMCPVNRFWRRSVRRCVAALYSFISRIISVLMFLVCMRLRSSMIRRFRVARVSICSECWLRVLSWTLNIRSVRCSRFLMLFFIGC